MWLRKNCGRERVCEDRWIDRARVRYLALIMMRLRREKVDLAWVGCIYRVLPSAILLTLLLNNNHYGENLKQNKRDIYTRR